MARHMCADERGWAQRTQWKIVGGAIGWERTSIVQSVCIIRIRGKEAKALDAHFAAFRRGRGQRKWPRMDRGGKDARVPLGRLPILTTR
eukprot:771640-Pyramimonas_sp.AAC.1